MLVCPLQVSTVAKETFAFPTSRETSGQRAGGGCLNDLIPQQLHSAARQSRNFLSNFVSCVLDEDAGVVSAFNGANGFPVRINEDGCASCLGFRSCYELNKRGGESLFGIV